MIDANNAIEVRDLTKRFGSQLASDHLNLTVRTGTTFGLLGPNGAGKSTLIRMLMGLSHADCGSAHILGFDALQRSPEIRRRVGYVPELHYIYPWMKVREVLKFTSQLYADWNHDLADDLLSKFDLPLNKRVSNLSKGMTVKLGLLVALAHDPELLILDEPTSGLDPIMREDFMESVLQRHIASGKTVLFSSHHVDDVERVSDEVGIIVDGKLVMQGLVDELRCNVKRIRAVLRDGTLPKYVPNEAIYQRLSRREWSLTVHPFSDELLDRLQGENEVSSVEPIDLNLEDIFKDLVRGRKGQSQEIMA